MFYKLAEAIERLPASEQQTACQIIRSEVESHVFNILEENEVDLLMQTMKLMAGESFARQSILKEMRGWNFVSIFNRADKEYRSTVVPTKDGDNRDFNEHIRDMIAAKLKGEGV